MHKKMTLHRSLQLESDAKINQVIEFAVKNLAEKELKWKTNEKGR